MISVSRITFAEASATDRRSGLLGFVSFILDGTVRVDGVALRRTQAGALRLSFPGKPGRDGREWPYVRPINDETRLAIEAQVFDAIGLGEERRP